MSDTWNFLTNHGHILILFARDGTQRIRDLADKTQLTQRAVQLIVVDLVEAGYLIKLKSGRRNSYEVNLAARAQHNINYTFDVKAVKRLL